MFLGRDSGLGQKRMDIVPKPAKISTVTERIPARVRRRCRGIQRRSGRGSDRGGRTKEVHGSNSQADRRFVWWHFFMEEVDDG